VSFFIIIFKPVTEKKYLVVFQSLLPMKSGVTGFPVWHAWQKIVGKIQALFAGKDRVRVRKRTLK
jgi:hypothetical protein